jgi:hypothetical protein
MSCVSLHGWWRVDAPAEEVVPAAHMRFGATPQRDARGTEEDSRETPEGA